MKRMLAALVAAALLVGAPGLAFGATAPPRAAAPAQVGTPATPELLDVQLWPEDVPGAMTLIIVAVVPESAKLPASVAIPLPKGATITWAGEVFVDTKQDVARQPVTAPDGSSITVVTQKSRLVQYEAQYKPYTDRGERRYAQLDWVQSGAAGAVQFSIQLPRTANDVKSDPAFKDIVGPNEKGERMYTLAERTLKAGEAFKLSVDYATKPSALPSQKRGPDVLLISLGGLLAVALAALAVLAVRRRAAP